MKQRYYIMHEECEDEYQVIDRDFDWIEKFFSTYEAAREYQDIANRLNEEWVK